jgi:biopolymer transport protein ExbD
MAWKLTSGHDRPIAEINITPLTDVMLVLLVIFMVTSPLLMMESMKLKLPKSQSAGEEKGLATVVSITSEGRYFLNDDRIEKSELEGRIGTELKADGNDAVILKADESVRHGLVVEVLDIARKAGAKKLSIATEPKADRADR